MTRLGGTAAPFFSHAHIDGVIATDPAVYARLAKVQRDEARTQGLGRRELIRFLRSAQATTLLHGALAFLLGIKGPPCFRGGSVRIVDCAG